MREEVWVAFPKEKSAGHPSPDQDCAATRVSKPRIHLRRDSGRTGIHFQRLHVFERDVVYAKGLCQKHYRRWRKHGDALYERPKKESQPKCPPPTVCSVEGCGATHYGQGHCQTHYNRWKAHGDPLWMPTHGVRRAPAPVALRDAQTQPSRVGGARAQTRGDCGVPLLHDRRRA